MQQHGSGMNSVGKNTRRKPQPLVKEIPNTPRWLVDLELLQLTKVNVTKTSKERKHSTGQNELLRRLWRVYRKTRGKKTPIMISRATY